MEEIKPLTRFGEFDLLKAIAILLLPAVHLLDEAIEGGFASHGLLSISNVIIALCALAPSVIMICIGFDMSGRRSKPDSIQRTGIQFLLIGAILNAIRWFLPGTVSAFAIHTNIVEDFEYCLQSDSYFFIGLFYILYSILLRYKVSPQGLLMITTGMLTVNTMTTPFLHSNLQPGIFSSVIGNFLYVDDTSCFPLFSWAIFPTVGIMLGEVLKKASEEERQDFMKRIMGYSFVVFFSMLVFLKTYRINESITDFPNVVLLVSQTLFVISIAYYLCKLISDSKFMDYMLRISAFSIPFYMLHWILIAWLSYGLDIFRAEPSCFGIKAYLACVTVVTAFCAFIATRYGKRIMKPLLKATTIKV